MEPETRKHGTDWQWPERRGVGGNSGKKGKGLDKEHVWMTDGHSQQCGIDCGNGWWGGQKRAKGKNWNNYNRITTEKIF